MANGIFYSALYTPRPFKVVEPFPLPCSPYIPDLELPAPLPPTPGTPEAALGKSIGNFELTKLLCKSGMGNVYLGKHSEFDKQVAIKLLRPEFSSHLRWVARLYREAQVLARLKQPNLVKIYDIGSSPELGRYLVMELLEGESLHVYLQRERHLSAYHATKITCEILEALVILHEAGVVPNDIKSTNIFLAKTPQGRQIKLLNFKTSKYSEPHHDNKASRGFVVSSAAYPAKQVSDPTDHSHKLDLYAVGVLLFELVTGQKPFLAQSIEQMLQLSETMITPKPSAFAPNLPLALEKIILHCLERRPEDRPQSAWTLLQTLQVFLETLKHR